VGFQLHLLVDCIKILAQKVRTRTAWLYAAPFSVYQFYVAKA